MGVHLPHAVILNHILPSIPAKSVYRFMCVSKEWLSFLTSDTFQNKYNRLHVNDHKLLMLSKTKTSSFEFTTINRESPLRVKGLSPTSRPLPPFEGISPGSICILASFHGLVCLGISIDVPTNEYSNLILWNPLTNEYKRLSRSKSHNECNNIRYPYSAFGLYYNCCEDDYKLLSGNFHGHNFYIYSLKMDSWRKVDVFPQINLVHPGLWSRATYLNENLYFLQHGLSGRLASVLRFDTKTERLSKIKTPNLDADPNAYNYFTTIMVKSDCVHVCVKYDDNDTRRTCIKLWKMDESGNMEQVVTYQLRKRVYDTGISFLIPFHLMKNGKWLMRARPDHQIYKVDIKKKIHIQDKGEGKEKGSIYDDFEYVHVTVGDNTNRIVDKEVTYIETFVSPNRYMK